MAHLFPRSYKEKVLKPDNKLEVIDAGSPPAPQPPPQREQRQGPTLRKTQTHAATAPAPSPQRQVWLTTVRKEQPLKRYHRVIKSGQDRRDRERKAREDLDPVDECTDTASFNELLRTSLNLPRAERKALAIKVISKMKANSIPLNKGTYNTLLQLLVDSEGDECFRIYAQMKEAAYKEDTSLQPDMQTYHILIRACERMGAYDKAFQLFGEMKEMFGIVPDVAMYNTVMGFCVHSRNEQQASQLFEEMKERRIQPNVHTYNCLMNVFAESPCELITQMFEDMLKQRIKPNLRTYNTLMRVSQAVGDYDKAFKYFEEIKAEGLRPDVTTYNILIEMCKERLDYVQERRPLATNRRNKEQQESGIRAIAVLSLSLFNEMDEREVRPNTYTYNALMGVLARCADLRVFTVFRAMKEDAKEEEEDRKRLQELIDTGELKDAEGALVLAGLSDPQECDLMLEDGSAAALRGHYQRLLIGDDDVGRLNAFGVNPDLTTYQTLIHAAERMGKPESAFEVFQEMKEAGIKPDRTTYMKMMDVCVINCETKKALELFRESLRNKLIPDIAMYNAFMNVLAEAGDETIFDVFEEILTDSLNLNIRPNQQTYNTLIKACSRLRRPGDVGPDDQPPTDENEMRLRGEQEAALNHERAAKAFELYKKMCDPHSPVKPDVETYNTLMDVCYLNKDIAMARDLIQDMHVHDITPEITTYNRMMAVFVAADDDGISEIFNVLRSGPGPNLDSYTILLEFHTRRKDPAILQLFDDMKKSGMDPDSHVYNIMLNYCAAVGDKRKALKFFEELKVRELPADINTYNALMAVFSESGDDLIFKVFEEMIENRIVPNKITFSTLIKHKKGLDCLKRAGEKGLLDPRCSDESLEPPS